MKNKDDMKEIIRKTAHLARLNFPDEELSKYTKKAQAILDYVEQLNELDTSKIEPTSHAIEVKGELRDDKAIRFAEIDEILNNVPERDGGFIQVPKVLEGE